jgi:hypothetical protein
MALARPRSSLLRCGVTIGTAVWDAGYSGRSRSLLVVHNARGFRLQQGARVAQLVFFGLTGETGLSRVYQGENLSEFPGEGVGVARVERLSPDGSRPHGAPGEDAERSGPSPISSPSAWTSTFSAVSIGSRWCEHDHLWMSNMRPLNAEAPQQGDLARNNGDQVEFAVRRSAGRDIHLRRSTRRWRLLP